MSGIYCLLFSSAASKHLGEERTVSRVKNPTSVETLQLKNLGVQEIVGEGNRYILVVFLKLVIDMYVHSFYLRKFLP